MARFLLVGMLLSLAAPSAVAQVTFGTAATFGTGANPQAITTADFNRDGRPDLATANAFTNDVSILLGDGLGGFAAATTFTVGTGPFSIVTADFNGDGKADLATANATANNVSILLGNGAGGFGAATNFGVGASPRSLVVGDFNGDGKKDIAVANFSSGNVSLLLGNGAGGFGTATSATAGTNPRSVAIGDFNLDGKQDLAVANFGGNNVSILIGNGLGAFAAPANLLVGNGPASLATGDFNSDGKLDLATANSVSNNVSILLGAGTGGFGGATNVGVGSAPVSIAVSDFNLDGRRDLAVANSGAGSNDVSILLGNSSGAFAAATNFAAIATNPQSVAVADFNLDGRQDMATANYGSSSTSALLNTTPAPVPVIVNQIGFAPANNFAVGISQRAATVGDFNRDGWLDTATAFSSGGLEILIGNGFGTFATPATFVPAGSSLDVDAADFNGDGNLDLAVASGAVDILLGDGTGGFSAPASFPAGSARSLAITDFNRDGNLDVVTANISGGDISILLGDGAGGLGPAAHLTVGADPYWIAVGDFNRDGKDDVAVTLSTSNQVNDVVILLGDGAGGMGAPASFPVGRLAFSVAVGDLNMDGKLDLAVANYHSTNVLSVLLGDGAGGFGAATSIAAGVGNPISVTVADLNSDGKLDLATAGNTSHNIAVLLGDGAGGFGPPNASFYPRRNPIFLATADFNNDGKPDLLCAGDHPESDSISLLLNTSAGSLRFSSATYAVTEAVGTATISVERTGGSAGAVAVNYATSNGTALSGVDYTVTSGTLAWADGDGAAKAFTVAVAGDGLSEPPESINLTLLSPTGGVVLGSPAAATLRVLNPLTLGPATSYSMGPQGEGRIEAGDFDGDGRSDVVTSNQPTDTLSLLRGNGMGGLGSTSTFATGDNPIDIAVGDLNSDGILDVAVANRNSNDVSVLLGNGSGGFGTATQFATGSQTISVATGDFNEDGKLDLLVGSYDSHVVSIMLGNGSGGFGPPAPFVTGVLAFSIAVSDLNLDGKLDAVIAGERRITAETKVSVLLGTGSGALATASEISLTAGTLVQVATGDFNADGKPDAAVCSRDSSIRVLLGDGTGGLGGDTTLPTTNACRGLAIADLNADGSPDLIGVGEPGTAAVFLGTGAGGFMAALNAPVAAATLTGVAAGDFNDDGQPDLAVRDSNNASVAILLNSSFASSSSLRFSLPAYTVSETGGTVTIPVQRTGGSTGAVSVQYATAAGTATPGNDYTPVTGTLSWASGDASPKAFAVAILDDAVQEPVETILLILSNPTGGAALASPSSATLTVLDDQQPTVSVSDASINEGNSGTATLTFNVTLSYSPLNTLKVNFATANGTGAIVNGDYVAQNGTLTFPANGPTSQTVLVTVNGDVIAEPDETMFVNISQNATSAQPYTITDPQGLGVILNDDFAPTTRWSTIRSLIQGHTGHTTTLLPNGKLLVAGGDDATGGGAELFETSTGAWTATGSLAQGRKWHTATLLPTGQVLVVGGLSGPALGSAELYNPATGRWSGTQPLASPRYAHTATLLPNGRVLVVGGRNGSNTLQSAEIYDPATGQWTPAASLAVGLGRGYHTATLLATGNVLVAGGKRLVSGVETALRAVQVYHPGTGLWSSPVGLLNKDRPINPSATLLPSGEVLLVGGSTNLVDSGTSETFDPIAEIWTTASGVLTTGRYGQSATLLPSGLVLVAGGYTGSSTILSSAEVFTPATSSWSPAGNMSQARQEHTAILLPTGKVLVAGGSAPTFLTSVELYDPFIGTWTSEGTLRTARSRHTTTLLTDGTVLAAGGRLAGTALLSADRFDPATGLWTETVSGMNAARYEHTATLLPDGKVLLAGGRNTAGGLQSADLFNSAAGVFTSAGTPVVGRFQHTATLLPSGTVLLAGGQGAPGVSLSLTELYHQSNGAWTTAAPMSRPRFGHTATVLPSGLVLVTGGYDGGSLAGCQIYDPDANTWRATGSMNFDRAYHTATLLPNGKVFVAGGKDSPDDIPGAGRLKSEVFDPATEIWSLAGEMTAAHDQHSAVILTTGDVLVAGGATGAASLTTEVFDPLGGTWRAAGSMNGFRQAGTVTLLSSGKVLAAGGNASPATEVYLLDYSEARRPVVQSMPASILYGVSLSTSGHLKGDSEASDGRTGASAVNYPTLQLRSMHDDRLSWLVPASRANFSDDPMTLSVTSFPSVDAGWYRMTVMTAGIPSVAKLLEVQCRVAILQEPQNQSVAANAAATFSVGAVGARTYQWLRNGVEIQGAVGASYTTPPVTPADAGSTYRVQVTGRCGQQLSAPALLSIVDTVGPVVTVQLPAGGQRLPLSVPPQLSQHEVVWTATDTVRVCKATASLEYSNNGGASWISAATGGGLPRTFPDPGTVPDPFASCNAPGLGPEESNLTYTVPSTFPSGQPGSLYRVRVQAWDLNQNPSAPAMSGAFYIVKPDPEAQTLILWNRARMQTQLNSTETELDELAAQLESLAAHARVRGVVEDLGEAVDEPLSRLYAKWDAAPLADAANQHNWANTILFGCDRVNLSQNYPTWCSPDVRDVEGIQDLVTKLKRTVYANLRYVILVGDDRIIPFARLVDQTPETASEERYAGAASLDLRLSTTVGRALAANFFLSDDPLLTDAVIRPDDVSGLFKPDFSGGRLVERADEIIKTVATFMGQDGVMDLTAEPAGHRVLVTGYDFMLPGAQKMSSAWAGVPGVGPLNQVLLGENWSAADLRAGLQGHGLGRYGVMSPNGHASHFLEGVPVAGGGVSGLNALDVYGADKCSTPANPLNADFNGAVVYSMGCHGGLVVPGSCSSTADHSLDLPQTFLARGAAVYLGNTGYGYGDAGVVGYSMLLSDLFTQRLVGEHSIAVGEAVRMTKADSYFRRRGGVSDITKPGRVTGLDAYDRKVLMQWTLFGVPMYELRLRTGTAPLVAAASTESSSAGSSQRLGNVVVKRRIEHGLEAGDDTRSAPMERSATLLGGPPQYVTKLSLQFDLSATDVYAKWHGGLKLPSLTTVCEEEEDEARRGCYYALNDIVTTGSGMPVQPMMVYDSRLSGTSQHGVLWMGGTYVEEHDWIPVFGRVVTNGFENNEPQPAPRYVMGEPIATQTGSSQGGCRAADDQVNSMAIVTGDLLRAEPPSNAFTIERRYVSFDAEVLYYNNTVESLENCERTGPGLSVGGGDFAGGAYHRVTGGTVEWAARDLPVGVWRVVVVFNDEANSRWEPLELVKDVNCPSNVPCTWRGSKTFAGATRVRYVLQAVDDHGNVGRLRVEEPSATSEIVRTYPLVAEATIDPPPGATLSISDVTVMEGNAGTTSAQFSVNLSAASAQTVTVSAVTSDLSANAGSDYTATGPTTITFAPGTTTQTFSVPVVGDATAESSETFQVTLSSPTNATILDGVGVGTITNDDASLSARAFVSMNGNDANDCSNQTTPCRNLAGALVQVAIDGEIIVLNSGDYAAAPVTITRGVKISSPSGTVAFVRHPLTVNAPGGRVVLRGLSLKGSGSGNAVTLTAGDALSIEDTTIDGWSVGLKLNNSSPALVTVSNSVFRASVSGINDGGGAVGNRVSVEETRFEGNTKGIEITAGSFTIRESAFVGNSGSGVIVGPGSVDIQRSEFSLNGTAVSALSGGTARISRSRIFGNGTGLSAAAGSTVTTTGRNLIRRNGVNVFGTVSTAPEQ